MLKFVVAVAAAAVLASACSSSGGGDWTATKAPTCASLVGDAHWIDKMPGEDRFCLEKSGDWSLMSSSGCGKGVDLYQFGDGEDSYWALSNGPVTKITGGKDPAFDRVFWKCMHAK